MENIIYENDFIKIVANNCENALNPRELENIGKMFCLHKKYVLGDYEFFKDIISTVRATCRDWDEVYDYLDRKFGIACALNLYLLDHSSLWMNTYGFHHVDPQKWDWGQVGFIFATEKTLVKSKIPFNKVREILEKEVRLYSDFISGNAIDVSVIDIETGEIYDNRTFFGSEVQIDKITNYIDIPDEKFIITSRNKFYKNRLGQLKREVDSINKKIVKLNQEGDKR